MAVHICRDFLGGTRAAEESFMYLTSIYLHGVMQFTHVGNTNFDLMGTHLISSGTGASIAAGAGGIERLVTVPGGQHTVTIADIDRIVALRSSANPRFNSGLFRITAVDTTANAFFIDYRTSSEPPVESGTLTWALYLSDEDFPALNNTAGSSTYPSRGTSTCSRIILQSPGNSFQVRLCFEASTFNSSLPNVTIGVGIEGDSSGDFEVGGEHNHTGIWFDNNTLQVLQNFVCGVKATDNGGHRFYMWGDDDTESFFGGIRDAGCGAANWVSFGLTENEELPLASRLSQRLYSMGNTGDEQDSWDLGFGLGNDSGDHADVGGTTFGLSNRPVSCVASAYVRLDADVRDEFDNSWWLSEASDNIFDRQTELMTLDVVAGTHDSGDVDQGKIHFTEVRRLGSWPNVRLGRSNFGDWTLSTDTTGSWIHTQDGIYVTWNGPNILP